jgi:hypothetical protein
MHRARRIPGHLLRAQTMHKRSGIIKRNMDPIQEQMQDCNWNKMVKWAMDPNDII